MNTSSKGRYTELSRQVLVVSVTVALVGTLLALFWYARRVFFLVFGGVLLAVLIRGVADWVSRKTGINRTLSITLVIFLILILVSGFSALFGMRIYTEASKLVREIPGTVSQVQEKISQYPLGRRLTEASPQVKELAGSIFKNFSSIFFSISGAVMALVFIVFVGIYLAYDPGLYIGGFLRLFPQRQRDHVGKGIHLVGFILHWWLIGRLITMTVLGVLTGIGLWLLGIKMALTLGLFAGLMGFVPYLGPILSFIPVMLISFSQGLNQVLWVLLLYAGVQVVESYILTPLVFQRTVLIPPLLTLTAQVILGMVAGVVGIVFAMPFTAALIVLIKYFYIQDVLGEPVDIKGG